MTTTATGPYQHAREIALRIQERPNTSARELYRLFGEQFAQWNCDGDKASALIAQHLAKFESDGLVTGEKSGKKANDPKLWVWVGPKPSTAQQAIDSSMAVASTIDPNPQVVNADPVPEHDEKTPSEELQAAIKSIEHAFTRAYWTRPVLARRKEKIACMKRLADIAAPDISELLLEIANDIGE